MSNPVFIPIEKFNLPEEIIGKNVIIKRRSHQYDEELFKLIDSSRDFLKFFLYWVDTVQSLDDVVKTTDDFSKNWDEQNAFEYIVLDKNTNKLVAAGGVHTISHKNHIAELGYYRDVKANGGGYVTEFVALLEKELFSKGIHRLEIGCDTLNPASAKVAERNGFKLEGTFKHKCHVYGQYRDEHLYAKIK